MSETPPFQKPLHRWTLWRTWAVRREWNRQVRCMADAGYRRTGWASWDEPNDHGRADTMTGTAGTDPFEDRQLYGTGDLARFLGGSEDSFTGLLLVLLQKADPFNVARIRMGFPEVVEAWETWNAMSPCPTPRQLREALTDAEIRRASVDL